MRADSTGCAPSATRWGRGTSSTEAAEQLIRRILATCLGRRNDLAGAARVLDEARRREPSNPIVTANIGILQATRGDNAAAVRSLRAALAADPNLHEARFNLALAYARLGKRADAV